jgi:hypothetical protein
MIERRKTARKQAKVPMKISLFEEGKESASVQLEGNTRDIGLNGFGLEIKVRSQEIWEKLKDFTSDTGKVFLLHMEVLSSEKKLVADGTVAWCRITSPEEKEIQIGVFLNRMDAAIREEWHRFVEQL